MRKIMEYKPNSLNKYTDAVMRLFGAVPSESKTWSTIMMGVGYIVPELEIEFIKPVKDTLMRKILSNEDLNKTFFSSWKQIMDRSGEQLDTLQILHYVTAFLHDIIPTEVLIPRTMFPKDRILSLGEVPLKIVKGMTSMEIRDKAAEMIGRNVALSTETIDDLLTILGDRVDLTTIENKELLAKVCVAQKLCPKDPVDILRCIIYELTGTTLLIKNKALINAIKSSNGDISIWKDPRLAQIFYRYKPLFLAMKPMGNSTFINQLRRSAKYKHKPLNPNILHSVSHHSADEIIDALEKTRDGFFKAAKIVHFLTHSSGVYFIRNGKTWVEMKKTLPTDLAKAYSIARWMSQQLTINAPEVVISSGTHLAIPTSEKMFAGNFPLGTRFDVTDKLMLGIHWTDPDTDLDISATNPNEKVAWDGNRLSNHLLFSGDLVTGQGGATEYLRVTTGTENPYIANCNCYAGGCEYKIIIGQTTADTAKLNYIIKPNEVVAQIPADINKGTSQTVLGVIQNNSFTLIGRVLGAVKTTKWQDTYDKIIGHFSNTPITLLDIIKLAGVSVVTEPTKEGFLDLRNENLSKGSLLELVNPLK